MGGAVESGFGGGVLFSGNLVAVVLCGSSTCKLELPIVGGVCVDSCVGLGGGTVLLFADGIWVVGRAERYSSTNRDQVKGCDCGSGVERWVRRFECVNNSLDLFVGDGELAV